VRQISLLALAIGLPIVLVLAWYHGDRGEQRIRGTELVIVTLLSPDKTQEYMADGMAEELLNLLSKAPDLKVIARTSSFAFKGKDVDISEIARQLNVPHLVQF
jgi:TolB-like protein